MVLRRDGWADNADSGGGWKNAESSVE